VFSACLNKSPRGLTIFRPISGDGIHFGVSTFNQGMLAFSRILNDQEVIVIANTNTTAGWTGEVVVDVALNAVGSSYIPVFSNKTLSQSGETGGMAPGPVAEKAAGRVEIHETSGAVTRGPARALPVTLAKMEMQILVKIGE
jgi:hypothetical protein